MPIRTPLIHVKKRVAAVLYRYPQLFHIAQRIWFKIRWWAHLAGSQVFRRFGRVPEVALSLDPQSVRLRAPLASVGSSRWESGWEEIADDEGLRELANAALSVDPHTSPVYRDTAVRLERGERPFGFADRGELDEEIAAVRAQKSDTASEIEVWIGESGKIGLRRGLLQLATARARGDIAIQARVGRRHPAWDRLRRDLAFDVRHRGSLYQKVLHPDFELFPALQVCVDRIRIVEPHLPTGLRTALDLGASFGQFSRFLEDHGFEVTAAEESPPTLHYLRLIRDTMGYSFEIFPHDVRTYRPSKAIDVLWAMSVLHCFMRTGSDQESLVALLGRLRPKVVFFEPPRGDEYQDRGYYRTYPPDEFAEFVRQWCGLTKVEQLGVADTGRPIYKIS